jgi:hypothetical protein
MLVEQWLSVCFIGAVIFIIEIAFLNFLKFMSILIVVPNIF